MKVRTYLILLIASCSLGGVAVFIALNWMHYEKEVVMDKVNRGALLMRDIESLESSFSQWMLLNDLVLGADESYLCHGALAIGEEVAAMLHQIQEELNPESDVATKQLRDFVNQQLERIQFSQSIPGKGRKKTLHALLTEMDDETDVAITALENLRLHISSQHENDVQSMNTLLRNSRWKGCFLMACFLIFVSLLWLWISKILGSPISRLAEEASNGLSESPSFNTKKNAPEEVRRLAVAFSGLVNNLEFQIEALHGSQIEREKLHHELVAASRGAGMAEVASDVLHNVGNVLNSVTVSASLIQENLRGDSILRLEKMKDLLLEHDGSYGDFLVSDDRGKHFPAALDAMTKTLIAIRTSQLAEADSLIENIDHIRVLIRHQLSNTKCRILIESFQLHAILQKCMEINAQNIWAAGISVELFCPPVLEVKTDRHKLQQIVVNLIKNAVEAFDESTPLGREITIRVCEMGDDIQIAVSDTGIGIDEKLVDKLFQHGFTTKNNGHGFGLHSAALDANILGGSLSVASEGIGTGTTFRLTISKSLEQPKKSLIVASEK